MGSDSTAPAGGAASGGSGSGREFPSTLWSLVLQAGAGAAAALEELARRYAGPVYAFVRGSGRSREDAEDLAQDFFAYLIESRVLEKADPARGRFRGFLLASLRNFLLNEHDRRTAKRRGGGTVVLSLDVERAEQGLSLAARRGAGGAPQSAEDAARRFDREWAASLLGRALAALERELKPRAAEIFALAHDPEAPSYREIAARFDMTEGAVTAAVHRARRRLRELVLAEARATVATDAEVEEELRELVKALSQ